MRRFVIALMMLGSAMFVEASAQGAAGGLRPRQAMRANRRLGEAQPGQQGAAGGRQQLEQQVRRSLWKVAKNRIGFTDEQMAKLESTTQRFDARRRTLAQQERQERMALRSQIVADSTANPASVSASLDQVQSLQRQRLELQADEQKEFATFMTPLQRAKFMSLQEQVRKRLQDFVKNRPSPAGAELTP